MLTAIAVGCEDAAGTVGIVEQIEDLAGHAVDPIHIQDQLVVSVGILGDDVHLTGAPVGVDAGHRTAGEAVHVTLIVLDTVAVIPMEQGDQGDLLVQGPGAILYVVVQEGLSRVRKELMVEHRDEGHAVEGDEGVARDGVLMVGVFHDLIVAIGPPDLIEIQVLGGAEVDKGAAQGLGEHGVAGGGQHVVLVGTCLDCGGHLVDHEVLGGVVLLNADDLDSKPLLYGLVSLIDCVVDGLADEFGDCDLAGGPAVQVAADEGDLVTAEVQTVGEFVAEHRFFLGDGGSLLGGLGIQGGRVVGT